MFKAFVFIRITRGIPNRLMLTLLSEQWTTTFRIQNTFGRYVGGQTHLVLKILMEEKTL